MSQKQQTSLHRVHNAATITIPLFLLAACGGDVVTEVTEVHETGMKLVEKGDELPKCTTENEGAMIYALDSAAAYACINREWVSFNGKDGADGKDGRDGKDGEDGAKGEKGDKGDQGEKGNKGDKGDSGAKGDTGDQGTACSVEDTGDGYALITCGEGEKASTTKIFKGMCGETPYNLSTHFCDFRDSTIYRYVTIGDQTWMAENLYYKTDLSRCYNDSVEYCAKYGRYYSWADAMDSAAVFSNSATGCGYDATCTVKTPARGICPEGWHIPKMGEWLNLYRAMGESPYAMQAKGFEEWPDATDDFGFSVLPVGSNDVYSGSFYRVGSYSFFWSVSDGGITTEAMMWYLNADSAQKEGTFKPIGLSVRCLKD